MFYNQVYKLCPIRSSVMYCIFHGPINVHKLSNTYILTNEWHSFVLNAYSIKPLKTHVIVLQVETEKPLRSARFYGHPDVTDSHVAHMAPLLETSMEERALKVHV